MSTPNVGEASLSGEDRVRMERLFEEAVSRIREMYLIMDRITELAQLHPSVPMAAL
jgi:hypothetical protein